jgi:hypothetical protein
MNGRVNLYYLQATSCGPVPSLHPRCRRLRRVVDDDPHAVANCRARGHQSHRNAGGNGERVPLAERKGARRCREALLPFEHIERFDT